MFFSQELKKELVILEIMRNIIIILHVVEDSFIPKIRFQCNF